MNVQSKLAILCLAAAAGFAQAQPAGTIAHWKFDEWSGTTTVDSSGNNNHATIVGAVFVPGRFENALEFNGTGDHVFASDAASGGVTGSGLDMGARDWTVSAWVKTTSSGMLVTKMGFFGGSNPDGWGISISGNGTVGGHLRKLGAGEVNVFSGDGQVVNDGNWRHIAVVFNRNGDMVRYVDGLPTGTRHSLIALAGQSIDNTKQLRIGARDQSGNEVFFGGVIDDARVHSRALSGAEVAELAGIEPPDPDPDPDPVSWSDPVSLVSAHGRLAVGNRVHVVGHSGGNLVHRSSQDNGASWSAASVIAPASGNYPMQYGGLHASKDTVYLLTAAGHMGPSSQHLDFRKSTNNGAGWSSPIRITGPGQQIRRANIVASGEMVHVFGGQSGAGGFGTGLFYFRSSNGGETWEPGVLLHANADASARLAVDGTTLHVAFGDKITPDSFGGRTHYMRSADNGETWSEPVFIGESTTESDVQARQQIAAANGRVLAVWQRERPSTGGVLPADRLGYNRSLDGGLTWEGPEALPGDTGVNRNHQQVWMTPGGAVHLAWCHGDSGNPLSPTGYLFSPDYGATWAETEIAISTSGGNLPHSIVADLGWVHIIAEPGAGTYARRPVLPAPPFFTSIERDGPQVILQWAGNGILQWSAEVTGDWEDIPDATSPHELAIGSANRFFRLVVR